MRVPFAAFGRVSLISRGIEREISFCLARFVFVLLFLLLLLLFFFVSDLSLGLCVFFY